MVGYAVQAIFNHIKTTADFKGQRSHHSKQSYSKNERDYLAGVAAPASFLTHRVRGCNEIYHLK